MAEKMEVMLYVVSEEGILASCRLTEMVPPDQTTAVWAISPRVVTVELADLLAALSTDLMQTTKLRVEHFLMDAQQWKPKPPLDSN